MKTPLWLAVAVLLGSGTLSAQNPVYKPDQTVVVTVTFEGKDASKISTGSYTFSLVGNTSDDQPNFTTTLRCGDVGKVTVPGTLEISCTVNSRQADGEYKLNELTATVDAVRVVYAEGQFPARQITIQNHATLAKPKVKDVTVK